MGNIQNKHKDEVELDMTGTILALKEHIKGYVNSQSCYVHSLSIYCPLHTHTPPTICCCAVEPAQALIKWNGGE